MPDSLSSKKIRLAALEAQVYRAPIEVPVQTSFGVMHDRPAVLVRAVDEAGAEGWGEVSCNFPTVGAGQRARRLEQSAAPLLSGRGFETNGDAYRERATALEVLAIQTGELGPIAQVVAGVDIALWDL